MYRLIVIICVVCFQCTSDGIVDSNVKPEANRFEVELVVDNLNQPMSMDIINDGRIFFVEKDGAVKVVDPITHNVKTIAEIPVNSRFSVPYTTSGSKYDADDGMHGIVVDPDFVDNGFIYLYYSPQTEEPISQVVRYTYTNDQLDLSSKVVLLEWKTQRERCCHWGGGMVFDKDGNLLISTGDNSGGSMKNEVGDARRTSGNSNDLRGSILRIHPNSDGSYSIPEGNLFPEGTPNTKPEIYIMGVRNPWRLSMDSKTGWLFWGEVGPSTDEFNLAKKAGNFGWPFFIADNEKYLNLESDYDTTLIRNESVFNTGVVELPTPPVPALVWYDRNPSEQFPIPGSGSLSAVGGPVFRKSDFKNADRLFPAYYEGKWFVTDYVRGWIMVIELGENGEFKSMEEFMPEFSFTGINDMDFGIDGDLYVLQYGHDSYAPYAKDAKLFRIKYNNGNRKPIANATGNNLNGSVPLTVELNAQGSIDFDNNISKYVWKIHSESGESTTYEGVNPVIKIDNAGFYKAVLTVIDEEGLMDKDSIEIIAGNNAPEIDLDFMGSNRSFYFPGDRIEYSVRITDQEDRNIDSSRIKFWSDFLPAGYDSNDFIAIVNTFPANLSSKAIIGESLIVQNNCYQCHTLDRTAVGPSYSDVATKYKSDGEVHHYLSNKIIEGSVGVWGQVEMPSHPSISKEEASYIVDFILEATDESHQRSTLPLSGTIPIPSENVILGDLIIKVSYKDQGKDGLPELETDKMQILRNPTIFISSIDTAMGMRIYTPHFKQLNHLITNNPFAFVGVRDVDLSGISEIGLEIIGLDKMNDSDWELSIFAGSPSGELLGHSNLSDAIVEDEKLVRLTLNSISKEKGLYIVFDHNDSTERKHEIELRSLTLYR